MGVLGSRKEGGAGEGCACRAKDTGGTREPQPVPVKPQGKGSGESCLLSRLLLGMLGAGATTTTSHTPTFTGQSEEWASEHQGFVTGLNILVPAWDVCYKDRLLVQYQQQ